MRASVHKHVNPAFCPCPGSAPQDSVFAPYPHCVPQGHHPLALRPVAMGWEAVIGWHRPQTRPTMISRVGGGDTAASTTTTLSDAQNALQSGDGNDVNGETSALLTDSKKHDAPPAPSSSVTSTGLKVLVLLAVQNCSKNLLLRFVMKEHPKFLTSAAILGVESVKMVLALLYIVFIERRPASSAVQFIKQDRRNTALMCVPATLYSVQMTLEYIALGNIDASVFSVLVQTKLLATAGCAVCILGKKIKKVRESVPWKNLQFLDDQTHSTRKNS